MLKQQHKKKRWIKPVVYMLNIKKDTFSGSGLGAESNGKGPAYVPKDPVPRG
jgi:hypothetical protein